MSARERKHHSLAARVFHSSLMGSIVLGLVALAVGLGLYTLAVSNRYISQAFSLSRSAAGIIEVAGDIRPLSDAVMTAYREQTDGERAQTMTDAYHARFSALAEREDYRLVRAILTNFSHSSDADAIYLAMYDRDTCAMVYLCDPDENPETVMMPGDWDPVTRKGMEHFLTWDGKGMLYAIENTERYGWLCTGGAPIRGADGEVAAFVLSDITLTNVWDGVKTFLVQFLLALAAATLLVGFVSTRRMKKELVEPINQITDAAQSYVSSRRAGEQNTDHFGRLNIRTGDEVENLSLVMADMERELIDYADHLLQATAENERISTELSLATRIQADMLPNIYPAFPDRPEIDIYATMTPAREVGGDFYDYFFVDDDHLCMVIADVSGKGIPAALFMMASKIVLANNAKMGKSPSQILRDTNESVCSNNREEMFVTVWLGILELSTGTLTCANAGHEYPTFKHADGRFELYKDRHGLVIGGMAGMKYPEYSLHLEPGSKLFVYTDGVPETTDPQNVMFGTERMLAALNAAAEDAPEQILHRVREAVDAFARGAEQFDDVTMLCMQYNGPNPVAP